MPSTHSTRSELKSLQTRGYPGPGRCDQVERFFCSKLGLSQRTGLDLVFAVEHHSGSGASKVLEMPRTAP